MRSVPIPGYRAVGDSASLLCFHCSGSSSGQWSAMAERLGDSYRVVAVDLAGYGGSPPWADDESPSIAGEVARLADIGRRLPEPVHLVGHSYGGAVALRYALSDPGRVASLVLYEPVPFALLRHGASGRAPLEEIRCVATAIDAAMAAGEVGVAARRFFDYWSGQGTWDQLLPDVQQRLMRRMRPISDNFRALMADDTCPRELGRLAMPVLYLGGADPRAPVAAIQDVLEVHCPRMESCIDPDLGHMGPVSHPHRVNEHVARFIALHDHQRNVPSPDWVIGGQALPALA